MRINLRQWIMVAAGLWASTATLARGSRETVPQDVARWAPVTDRHVIGYDANEKPLAVYDLAWPNAFSSAQAGRMLLGTIGVGDLNLRQIIAYIKQKIAERHAQDTLDRSMRHVVESLPLIEKDYGDMTDRLPEGWENQVKWTNGVNPLFTGNSFRLDQIDFTAMARGDRRVRKSLNKLREDLRGLLGVDVGENFFANFEMVRIPTGGYQLYFKPGSLTDPNNIEFAKVVDFVRSSAPRLRAAMRLSAEAMVSLLATIVPPPGGSIIKVVGRRFIRLFDVQASNHRNAVWQLINDSKQGYGSPLNVLTAEEIAAAGAYVAANDANMIRRIFMRETEKYWLRKLRIDEAQVVQSNKWLDSHGYSVTNDLDHWFGIYGKGSDKTLFVRSRSFLGGAKPVPAIDYQHPHQPRIGRNFADAVAMVLDAIVLPIPGASSGISMLFEQIVTRSIRLETSYEARLAEHLRMRMAAGEDWSRELGLLYAQRVNPFMLDMKEEAVLIAARKAALHLP